MASFQPPPTYAEVVLTDPKDPRKGKFNPIWLKWFLDLASFVSSSGGGGGSGVVHNDTSGKQGGGGTEFYHLTGAQNALVAALTATAAQINAAAAYIAALTATTAQVNQLAVGLSVTVTLAKITAGGTNGSLTFTNGVLTAKVDPT